MRTKKTIFLIDKPFIGVSNEPTLIFHNNKLYYFNLGYQHDDHMLQFNSTNSCSVDIYVCSDERLQYGDCIVEQSNDFTLPAVLTTDYADILLYLKHNQWNLTVLKMISTTDKNYIDKGIHSLHNDYIFGICRKINDIESEIEIRDEIVHINNEHSIQTQVRSTFDEIFEEHDDVYQPLNRMDFAAGFNAAIEYYDNALYDTLRKLVQLKDLKDNLGKTEAYEREQPLAWEEARNIINEIDKLKEHE